MPRLIGKQSNPTNITLLIIATLGILTGLEYLGVINIINNFGNDRIEVSAYKDRH